MAKAAWPKQQRPAKVAPSSGSCNDSRWAGLLLAAEQYWQQAPVLCTAVTVATDERCRGFQATMLASIGRMSALAH